MLKKLLMSVIFFFLVLSIKSGYLLFIYLPVLIFYLFKDYKNMYYIYPVSLLSLIIFDRNSIILYIVIIILTTLFLHLYKYGVKKDLSIFSKPIIIVSTYITIINIIFILLNIEELYLIEKIIYPILSIIIYMFLDNYLSHILKDYKNIKSRFSYTENNNKINYVYLELLLSILCVISCVNIYIFNINLAIIVSIFFSMYLSRKHKNIYSLIYSLIIIIIGYVFLKIDEILIVMLISGVYLIKSIYTVGILNIFLAVILITNNTSNPTFYILIMITSIIFEILAYYLNLSFNTKEVQYKDIHMYAQKSVNDEILKFAGFLDRFVMGFQNPKGYNEVLSNGIKTIVEKHCSNCPNKNECFNKNKKTLYTSFKDVLVLNNDAIYNTDQLSKICFKYQSILNTSKILNQSIDFKNKNTSTNDSNNYILLSQITGVSNALKNYVIDTTSKTELDYQLLFKAKENLIDLEYYITYYEIVKSYTDDFLIKLGIKNVKYEEIKPVLTTLYESIIDKEVSVVLTNTENSTVYINIIPKVYIDITYSYGSIPSSDEVICGDNYLIKELDNGHMLFSISDGMGKGYSAFYESDMTLKLVDDIVNLNIESSTALEILNTFYTVQDYLERYATLDFLDINRHTCIANFYKMGANTSYIIKKDKTIEKIINKNLPLGIDEVVDQNTYKLEDEDIIIMSSDGILENFVDNELLDEFIVNTTTLYPEQIVYEILNYATKNEKKIKDDMTLIVLKIIKKVS